MKFNLPGANTTPQRVLLHAVTFRYEETENSYLEEQHK